MTFEVILHLMKNLRLHYVDILEKFKNDWALNKKYIAETLRLPYVTFEVILYFINNVRLHNVS